MTEVGRGVVPIRPDLSGFQSTVARETDGALSGVRTFAKNAALAIGGAFAVTKIVEFGKGVVAAASDMNETVSKARTIFGAASGEIEAWASTAAKSFGQSKQQALDAAGSFGNMFAQLGIGSEKTAEMSQSMVELASDFASFHNADITDVLTAQQAAFRGEYDALQRYIPTINAAAVEQAALAYTGKKTTKELTLQEKALATQWLMMENAGAAAGDFARTSDGLANKQRIFGARLDNLKAKIGAGLLPVFTAITGFLTDKFLPAIETVGRYASQVFDILFRGDFKSGPFAEDAGFVDTLFKIRDAIEQVAGVGKQAFNILFRNDFTGGPLSEDSTLVAGLFKIREGMEQVAGFVKRNLRPILIGLGVTVGLLAAPVLTVAGAAVFAYREFEVVRDVLDAVASFIVGSVIPAIVDLGGWLNEHREVLVGVGVAIAVGLVSAFVSWAAAATAAAAATVAATWPLIAIGAAIAALVAGVIYAYKNWDWFRGTVDSVARFLTNTVWPAIQAGVNLLTDHVIPVIAKVIEWWIAFQTKVGQVAVFIGQKIANIIGFFRDLADWFARNMDKILGPIDEILGKIGDVAGAVGGFLGDVGGGIGGVLGKLPGFDTGGVVPGPVGAPRLAVVHGGETVVPTHNWRAMRDMLPGDTSRVHIEQTIVGQPGEWEKALAARAGYAAADGYQRSLTARLG